MDHGGSTLRLGVPAMSATQPVQRTSGNYQNEGNGDERTSSQLHHQLSHSPEAPTFPLCEPLRAAPGSALSCPYIFDACSWPPLKWPCSLPGLVLDMATWQRARQGHSLQGAHTLTGHQPRQQMVPLQQDPCWDKGEHRGSGALHPAWALREASALGPLTPCEAGITDSPHA